MKKLLSILLSLSLISTTTTTLISCGSNNHFRDIYLITDSGKIDDKSFNETTFEAGNIFTKDILGIDKKISYIEPATTAPKTFKRAYKTAKTNKAKTLLLPGFHHSLPGEGENNGATIMEGSGSTIILDSSGAGKKNQVGVVFRGDVSGFYAGMSSIIYSLNNNNFTNNILSIGSFGGVSNPASVDNFIVGYLASIDVYNHFKTDNTFLETFNIKKEIADKVEVRMSQNEWPKSKDDKNWYSNSFVIGQSKIILDNFVNNSISVKPNVLMPVSGPQTSDVLNYDSSWKVVGVDTDQVNSFGKDGVNRFITSAEKDLVNSAIVSLVHTPEWINDNKYPGILEKVAETYKDKIQLTHEVINDDGSSSFEDIDISKDDLWTGKDVWVNGTMSYGGSNLLQENTAIKVKEFFKPDALTAASKELFTKYIKGTIPASGTIIAKEVVAQYATTIQEKLGE